MKESSQKIRTVYVNKTSILVIVLIFVAGCLAGFFGRGLYDKHGSGIRKQTARITGKLPEALRGRKGSDEYLFSTEIYSPDQLNEEKILSWLNSIRETRSNWNGQKAELARRMQLEQTALKIETNVRGKEPDSVECTRLKTRISGLQGQIDQLDAYIADLSGLDEQLCRVMDEIRTSGTIEKRPETESLKKAVDIFLASYKDSKEPWKIPKEQWNN